MREIYIDTFANQMEFNMQNMLLNNNLSLLFHQEIQGICKPFFDQYRLNHLNYMRLYNDNTVFYLCNGYGWLEHYLKQSYPMIGAFEQKPELRNFHYVLWSALDENDLILKDTREIFNTHHGIAIIKKYKDYYEFYNIGTDNKSQHSINFFINNYDILNQFTHVFKDKAAKLMRLACTNRIALAKPVNGQAQLKDSLIKASYQSSARLANCDKKTELACLTKAELVCIKLYVAGKISKEIANMLGISERTVEKHIENIKLKLNCKNLFQLGYVIAKAGIES